MKNNTSLLLNSENRTRSTRNSSEKDCCQTCDSDDDAAFTEIGNQNINQINLNKRKMGSSEFELADENTTKMIKHDSTPESLSSVDILTPSTPPSLVNNSVDYISFQRSCRSNINEVPKKDYFNLLPDEVLLLIFKMFQHKPSLVTCACVCRRWKNIAFDNDLWSRIELSQRKIKPGLMAFVLSRKPTILRMSQTKIDSPMFLNTEYIMENFVSKLEYLDLSMASINVNDLELLLRTCRSLLKLSLEKCEINEAVCKEIAKNTKLSVLNMSMCTGLDEPGLKVILTNCKKLLELNLAWTQLNTCSIRCVSQFLPKDIIRLNFSGCVKEMTDAHVGTLLIRCYKLKELDLSDAIGITENSIKTICDNLNYLEVLSLSRCYNICVASYTDLFRLPSITHLNIFGLFIEAQVESLRKSTHIKINTMMFSDVARPTVGNRLTSIWCMQVRD